MPQRSPVALSPDQQAQLRAETEAVRERIWQRWQAWQVVLLVERVEVRR
jgi:hypothetical protein